MIFYERFTSVDEVDFDRVLSESIDAINGNMYFPADVVSAEDRSQYFKEFSLNILAKPKSFATVLRHDGRDLVINIGVREGGNLYPTAFLLGTDALGSRSYIFTPEETERYSNFLKSEGITHMSIRTVLGSTINNLLLDQFPPSVPPRIEDMYHVHVHRFQ